MIDREQVTRIGRGVDDPEPKGWRRPEPPELITAGHLDPPDEGVLGGGVELDQLTEVPAALVLALLFDRHVDVAVAVGEKGGVGVVPDPVVEDDRAHSAFDIRNVEACHPAPGVGEVGSLPVDHHRALDGDIATHQGEQLRGPRRGLEKDLGFHRHQPVVVKGAVELDGEEPRVLAALVHHVVDHDRVAVPVVVPDPVDGVGVEAPQFDGLGSVECNDSKPVVSRTEVEQGEAVRVERDRALDDVAGLKRGPELGTGERVEKVDRLVVGTKDHLGHAIGSLPHHGLAGPTRSAPETDTPPTEDEPHMVPSPG